MTDPSGSATYRYERRGLLESEQKSIDGNPYSTTYQYDAGGRRTGLTYPSGRTVTFDFDYANRPIAAHSGSTTIVSSAKYLPFGPMTELVLGNGTTRSMQYDPRYLPTSNQLTGPSGVLANYSYGTDPGGNVTSIHDVLDTTFNRDFGYDDLNRLTTANSGTSLWGTGTYSYDAMGNIEWLTLGSVRSATFNYLGTTSKLSSVVENGQSQAMTYDAAGNETPAGSSSLYSPSNHLTDSDSLTYGYDGRGVRVRTSYPSWFLSAIQTAAEVPMSSATTGTVTLAAPAPAGGATVTLVSSNPGVLAVPASIIVPAGQTTATFTATASQVIAATPVTIAATFVYTFTSTVTITPYAPPTLMSLVVTPSAIHMTAAATGTVTLDGPAPQGGTTVSLTSSLPTVVSVPATVMIPAGQTSATFVATAALVTSDTPVTITATCVTSLTATLTVWASRPITVATLTPAAVTLFAGTSGQMTVTLTDVAPEGGLEVALSSSNASLLPVASSIAIVAGASSGTFNVTAGNVTSPTDVTLSATYGVAATATITLRPVEVASLTLAPPEVAGTMPATGTIQLNGVAPSGGLAVTLTSSAPTLVIVPASVTVPAGTSTASFAMTTTGTSTASAVVITASANGTSAAATLQVNPCSPCPAVADISSVTLTRMAPAPGDTFTSSSGGVSFAVNDGGFWVKDVSIPVAGSGPGLNATSSVSGSSFHLSAGGAGYSDAGIVLYFSGGLKLGEVQGVTVDSTGSPVSMNLWLDTGGDGTFFAFDGNGLLTSLAGDSYGGHDGPTFNGGSPFYMFGGNGAGNSYTLAELQAGVVPGITGNTVVALWIGITGPPNPAVASGLERQGNAPSRAQTAGGGSGGGRGWVGRRLAHWLELRRTVPPVSLGVTGRLVEGNTAGSPQRYSFYSPELNLLSETGVTTGTPTVAYDYIWFGGQPVAQVEISTGAVSWYFNDHLGTPILQTDATGTVVWRAEYEPYGKMLQYRAGAAKHQPLRFPGQEYDAADGEREYNIFRWYRAGWGRFSSVDPLSHGSEAPQTMNVFSYVMNAPMNWIDPLGACGESADFVGPTQPCDFGYALEIDVIASSEEEASAADDGSPSLGIRIDTSEEALGRLQRLAVAASRGDDFAALQIDFKKAILNPPETMGATPTYDEFWITTSAAALFEGMAALTTRIFTSDQQALVALAKELARSGATEEEANTMLQWAREYGLKGLDHSAPADAAHWVGGPHIHVGPIDHIPVQ